MTFPQFPVSPIEMDDATRALLAYVAKTVPKMNLWDGLPKGRKNSRNEVRFRSHRTYDHDQEPVINAVFPLYNSSSSRSHMSVLGSFGWHGRFKHTYFRYDHPSYLDCESLDEVLFRNWKVYQNPHSFSLRQNLRRVFDQSATSKDHISSEQQFLSNFNAMVLEGLQINIDDALSWYEHIPITNASLDKIDVDFVGQRSVRDGLAVFDYGRLHSFCDSISLATAPVLNDVYKRRLLDAHLKFVASQFHKNHVLQEHDEYKFV